MELHLEKQKKPLKAVGDDFYNALHVQLEQVDLQEALSPLLSNPRIKKYVEPCHGPSAWRRAANRRPSV